MPANHSITNMLSPYLRPIAKEVHHGSILCNETSGPSGPLSPTRELMVKYIAVNQMPEWPFFV